MNRPTAQGLLMRLDLSNPTENFRKKLSSAGRTVNVFRKFPE